MPLTKALKRTRKTSLACSLSWATRSSTFSPLKKSEMPRGKPDPRPIAPQLRQAHSTPMTSYLKTQQPPVKYLLLPQRIVESGSMQTKVVHCRSQLILVGPRTAVSQRLTTQSTSESESCLVRANMGINLDSQISSSRRKGLRTRTTVAARTLTMRCATLIKRSMTRSRTRTQCLRT